MVTEAYLFIALLAVAIVYTTRRAWASFKFHGKMLVTCPETHQPAAVKVNILRAALMAIAGRNKLALCDCSRWPERADCDQACLEQVETDPMNHRVRTIAAHWYAGKKCVYCGKPVDKVSHFDHSPALLNRQLKTAEWDRVPAERLPEEFSRDLAVCWSCHMTETFVREHPDLVVHRPWKKCGPLGEYVPKVSNPKDGSLGRAA
ncbi:MAG: hypothetical protein WB780_03800 [Candidatus Acidiferrales bacterium]